MREKIATDQTFTLFDDHSSRKQNWLSRQACLMSARVKMLALIWDQEDSEEKVEKEMVELAVDYTPSHKLSYIEQSSLTPRVTPSSDSNSLTFLSRLIRYTMYPWQSCFVVFSHLLRARKAIFARDDRHKWTVHMWIVRDSFEHNGDQAWDDIWFVDRQFFSGTRDAHGARRKYLVLFGMYASHTLWKYSCLAFKVEFCSDLMRCEKGMQSGEHAGILWTQLIKSYPFNIRLARVAKCSN